MIRKLEDVLRELERSRERDPDLYFFTFFGEPTANGAWGWRYEGHHCSQNWTIVNGKLIGSSPQFFGANPAEVRDGPMKGTRVLSAEEDLGRSLVKSLSAAQRVSTLKKYLTGTTLSEMGIFHQECSNNVTSRPSVGVTLFLTQNAVTDIRPEFLEDIKHTIKCNLGQPLLSRLGPGTIPAWIIEIGDTGSCAVAYNLREVKGSTAGIGPGH
jgi:hypothetical protein